jgi:anti-sigma-K factor RskA
LQLWCLVEGEAPRSVGVLTDAANETIRLPAAWFDGVDSWSLAVSDEPLGGSPTGLPTGTVLAAAEMTML